MASIRDTSAITVQPKESSADSEESKRLINQQVECALTGASPLDETTLQALKERLAVLRKNREAKAKLLDVVSRAQITKDSGRIYLPSSIAKEDDDLNMFFVTAADLLKLRVFYFNSSKYAINKTFPDSVTRFFWGLAFSLTDAINLEPKVRADEIENGRAAGFAIRVRGYFRQLGALGPEALKHNHRFFENDPKIDPKTRKITQAGIIETMFVEYFADSEAACELAGMAKNLLENLALYNIKNRDLILSIISSNLINFDEVTKVMRKKAKGEIKSRKHAVKNEIGKLPDKPGASPLLLKEEMEIVNELISPFWNTLEGVQQNWTQSVLKLGFGNAVMRVKAALGSRWQVVFNFSALTTKRLQLVRKSPDVSQKTSKRSVKREILITTLSNRTDAPAVFLQELRSLISHANVNIDFATGDSIALASPKSLMPKLKALPAVVYGKDYKWESIITSDSWETLKKPLRFKPVTVLVNKPSLADFIIPTATDQFSLVGIDESEIEKIKRSSEKREKKPSAIRRKPIELKGSITARPRDIVYQSEETKYIMSGQLILDLALDSDNLCKMFFGTVNREELKKSTLPPLQVEHSILLNVLRRLFFEKNAPFTIEESADGVVWIHGPETEEPISG